MNDLQLKVLLDALESVGEPVAPADVAEVLRWARAPDAVRELLRHTPLQPHEVGESVWCRGCAAALANSRSGEPYSHLRRCAVAAAWRALGDPRGAEDIERAHDEALRELPDRAQSRRVTALINGLAFAGVVESTVFNGELLTVVINGAIYPAEGDIQPGMLVGFGQDGIVRPYRYVTGP